jgi:hypothetical protein
MTTTNLNSFECPRCAGGGKVCWVNVDGGVCFKCNGTGRVASLRAEPVRVAAKGYAVVRPYLGGFAFLCAAATWSDAIEERNARANSTIAKYQPDGSLIFRDGTPVSMAV